MKLDTANTKIEPITNNIVRLSDPRLEACDALGSQLLASGKGRLR